MKFHLNCVHDCSLIQTTTSDLTGIGSSMINKRLLTDLYNGHSYTVRQYLYVEYRPYFSFLCFHRVTSSWFVNKASVDASAPLGQRNDKNSAERDQKLIKPGEVCTELAHQIWVKSDQRFVCKRTDYAPRISGQEVADNPWSMTKR